MSKPDQDWIDAQLDDVCPNCAGEVILYGCFDGQCVDAENGCEDCAYTCDWCQGKG